MTTRSFFLSRCSITMIWVFALMLLGARETLADRVEQLGRILTTDPSYKVRLQAALALGKLKNPKALPALTRALSDENYTIRGVAAAALGQIGDAAALPALKGRVATEQHQFVRSQIQRAIAALERQGKGPPGGVRFYLTIGKMVNSSGKGTGRLVKAFSDALLREFGKVSGVTTVWSGGRSPSAGELRKQNMQGFVLDGAILSVSRTRSGSQMELSCSIRVSLATYPDNSMKAFYTGGASMETSAGSFRPEQEEELFKEIVEGAAEGARQHIVQSYLSLQ